MLKRPRVNNQIKASSVRVIDEKGENVGVMPLTEALQMAHERGLDLIEVAAKVSPPVCRIMDFGKYMYQLEKKSREHSKSKKVEVKGMRISLTTARHDLEIRAKQAEKFLKQGHKIRIEMILHGREKMHSDLAKEKLTAFQQMIQIPTVVEQGPNKYPKGLTMIIKKN